jgi:hypothetical protein
MIRPYVYEVWKGGKQIGTVTMSTPIYGKKVVFPTISILKEKYGRKYETIELPVFYRFLPNNGVDFTTRLCLNANRKSKRQLKLVLDSKHER